MKPELRKGPIAWMAGNPVAANLLMIVLLVGGLILGLNIKQEVFPEFTLDTVTISVSYPGASPEEVEKGIILAIEEAVQGLDGVEEVSSQAGEGSATVTVEMVEGADLQKLAQDVQSEVDRISSFPDEAEEPQVAISSRRREVVALALYGNQDERVLREMAEKVRDRLLQDPDITLVELDGVRDLEIRIEISQDKLRAYNLTLDEVASRIKSASVELPGGGIKTRGGEILLRMNDRRDFGREFARIPIVSSNDGTEVLLEEIATVIDGFEDSDCMATYNGLPAVLLDIYRIGDQTPISVSDAVLHNVQELKQILPAGISLTVVRDMSNIYRQRMNLLLRNAALGLGLVFILLAVFLEARLAFWVSMGIPISFLGALFVLPGMDVSINMISMFAFIIALGIVVDDAIVVGENVYSYHQQGQSFLQAAIKGAKEIAVPVTFSVLTNIVAFIPMLFVPGIMGKIFKTIPIVVGSVFAISLVESLLILPAHLGHQKERNLRGIRGWLHRGQQAFSRGFLAFVRNIYGPFLDRALTWRYLVIALGVGILILTVGFVRSGRLGMTMFPKVESNYGYVTVLLPYGSALSKVQAVNKRLVQAAESVAEKYGQDKLVKGIYSSINANKIRIRAFLVDAEIRPISTNQFVNEWRARAGRISGLESILFESDRGGPGSGVALSIQLSHRNINILEQAGQDLATELAMFPNVKDVDDGFATGKQQLDFNIRPEGRSLGLTSAEVARQVRYSFYGAEALRQQRGRNEVKVMVRLPEDERSRQYNLEELVLRTPGGQEVMLRDVVNIEQGRAYTSIKRDNGRRVINVEADVTPRKEAGQILQALKQGALPKLISRYPGLGYSFEGKQADIQESMSSLFQGLFMALLAVYALLAVPFRSYIQPLIIMISIPFGIVGAVLGHILMGYSLSILSMFGILALSGVVVNDSLVLIDFANRRTTQGGSRHDAMLDAGISRFRPILLTTLTTFGGLAPMIWETSRQARFLIPMAISLGFGIVFATFITLLLVPCLYMVVEDLQRIGRWFEE